MDALRPQRSTTFGEMMGTALVAGLIAAAVISFVALALFVFAAIAIASIVAGAARLVLCGMRYLGEASVTMCIVLALAVFGA